MNHHNATVEDSDLEFFSRHDIGAYVEAVEALFRVQLPGPVETQLIVPLAHAWREDGERAVALAPALRKWLRFIYPGGSDGSEERDAEPPAHFPVARSWPQLLLSYAAISVLSQRPDTAWLPELEECVESARFCYRDSDTVGNAFRQQMKRPNDALGVLLRWGYTEAVLPDVLKYARSFDETSGKRRGWVSLARLLRCDLPDEFRESEQPFTQTTPVELISSFRAWLRGDEPAIAAPVAYEELETFACRGEFQALEAAEVNALGEGLREMLRENPREATFYSTPTNLCIHRLLPWLARYDPPAYHEVCLELVRESFAAHDRIPALMHVREVFPATNSAASLVELVLRDDWPDRRFSAIVLQLTQLVLFHGTAAQVCAWFEKLQDFKEPSIPCPINIIPIPKMIEGLAPSELGHLAEARIHGLLPVIAVARTIRSP